MGCLLSGNRIPHVPRAGPMLGPCLYNWPILVAALRASVQCSFYMLRNWEKTSPRDANDRVMGGGGGGVQRI